MSAQRVSCLNSAGLICLQWNLFSKHCRNRGTHNWLRLCTV